ncbi:hypothetical protein BpHYR1_034808 [Brachionus plicatilis]|uniref:Uncharacterized protein n=1 Tax=Brachionus plicatilis TaxID=10195 RepID=A0A3M7QEX0_BRAPC|nr:hypothetical protein BpHYR1_034808 [Brachionus plicatilis]
MVGVQHLNVFLRILSALVAFDTALDICKIMLLRYDVFTKFKIRRICTCYIDFLAHSRNLIIQLLWELVVNFGQLNKIIKESFDKKIALIIIVKKL